MLGAGGGLSADDLTRLFLSVALLLGFARTLGELARRLNQPAVLGEMLAGIVLGPTILGSIWPGGYGYVFPDTGNASLALSGLTQLGVVLFLLVAGLEVDLSTVWRKGGASVKVGVASLLGPFVIGFALAWWGVGLLGEVQPVGSEDRPLLFALFFATALSITALPLIAKTLMDLYMLRSDLGMIILASAVLNDLAGWLIFAVILSMLGTTTAHGLPVGVVLLMTVGYAAFMLTAGRWVINRSLPWIQAHLSWPGGVLAYAITLALLGAALTEWIGVHAIFGSFLVGVAMGDSVHLRQRTRGIIHEFISYVFAPLFFATIGLRVDFVNNFDLSLVLWMGLVVLVGKVGIAVLAGRWAHFSWRESFAIGAGKSATGAMGIILGLLGLDAGLINERVFVAIVVIAIVTSVTSGPVMAAILRRTRPRLLADYLHGKAFLPQLRATDRHASIHELAEAAARVCNIPAETIAARAWAREQEQSCGLGETIAIPNARLEGLARPVIAVGISPEGVDFDARDGLPARLILLILTPASQQQAQLEIVAQIARIFSNAKLRSRALGCTSFTPFLALVRTGLSDQEG